MNESVQSLSSSDDMFDLHRQTTVWSASLDGQIVGWDPVTLTAKKEVKKSFSEDNKMPRIGIKCTKVTNCGGRLG